MRKIVFIFTTLLLISKVTLSQDRFDISILTCSPGTEVYSVFGHSSIRVVDRLNKTDQVYNFGIFDFDTPNFAYKFLKGKLQYKLGIRPTPSFINVYASENRFVSEQVLNLTEEEEITIVRRLNYLYLPENRFYYYSFLNRNCSTELRDLLLLIGVDFADDELPKSNRELLSPYLTDVPWLRLGVNMLLGMRMDTNSNRPQSTFLPDYLRDEVDAAKLNGNRIISNEQKLNELPDDTGIKYQRIFSPIRVFSLLCIILLFWNPKGIRIALSALFGISGVIIGLLWIFSGHPEIRNNLDVLWCNPLYLLYIPMLIRNKHSKLLSYTLLTCLALTALIWLVGIQKFDIAVIPLMLILGLVNYKGLANYPNVFSEQLNKPY